MAPNSAGEVMDRPQDSGRDVVRKGGGAAVQAVPVGFIIWSATVGLRVVENVLDLLSQALDLPRSSRKLPRHTIISLYSEKRVFPFAFNAER